MRAKVYGTALIIAFIIAAAPPLALPAWAHPEFAEKTAQGCLVCHTEEQGGDLTDTGVAYAASGHAWPPVGGMKPMYPLHGHTRAALGFVHFVAAFMWFGTILYVHIVLRPAYAAKGLPHMEMMIGLVCMALAGVTGGLLTVSKIGGMAALMGTPWGHALSAKIALYAVMVSSALFVVTVVRPRLRAGARLAAVTPRGRVFGPLQLAAFDGKESRPAYVAYQGAVHDVTGLTLWAGGRHFKQHQAGEDLTGALSRAPHGVEKLAGAPVVGAYDPNLAPPLTAAQKLFYVIAYMNLGLVFATLAVVAWWRWGV